ncbi:hypothetical protein ACVIGB_000580 [Bradyrhizobium sp. USDA 4341]
MNEQAQAATNSASTDGREQAGKLLAEWFGYSWDGLYDRRIADSGFKPWTFNGLGNKEFQGGKRDVLDIVDRIAALASYANNVRRADGEVSELLERADRYLSTIPNRSDAGPHHLVSDLSAALRSALADTFVAANSPSDPGIHLSPAESLISLADQIDEARDEYANKFGTTDEPAAKEALISLLWDDKGTFAPALRLAALSIASRSNEAPQELALAQATVPNRDLLVRAIATALARDDLEPSSEATLELYRKDAEFIVDGLVRCSFPLQLASRRWRHMKRGSSYAEIGRATSQSAIPIVEGETVVVYVADIDGSMHVRKDAEFEDGRFEELNNIASFK